MRRFERNRGLLRSFLLNSVFHLSWTVPAWICLVLGITDKISVWWSVGCFVLYFLIMLIISAVLCALAKGAAYPEPKTKNKNPYSASNSDMFPADKAPH